MLEGERAAGGSRGVYSAEGAEWEGGGRGNEWDLL